ncbi:MAG: hypothetical protein PHW62_07645 [Candidatus Ratteibacteria bacterium]|nr:hypothetical protein [Candidatus Ratteibacteria bacterium]
MKLERTIIKWIFFGVMIFTVPVLFFVFAAGGFVPLIAIAVMTAGMLFYVFRADHSSPLVLDCLINLIIHGAILYFLASLLGKFVSLLPEKYKVAVVIMFVLFLLSLPFLPVYGISTAQGGDVTGSNIITVIRSLF